MAIAAKPDGGTTAATTEPSPAKRVWLLVSLYLGGLIALYAGERIFSGMDTLRYVLSGGGVAAMVFVTGARLSMAAGQRGERRAMDRRLAYCSLGGLLGVLAYFTTTPTGMKLLGVGTMAPDARARFSGIVTVGFISVVVLSVVPLVFGEAAYAPMRRAERPEARRVLNAILGGLSISLAAVYGSLFAYAVGEAEIKWDFSYYRTAQASESTTKIVSSINEDVVAMVFFPPVNEVGTEVEAYVQDLAAHSPNFKVELHDRLLAPALAREHKVTQDGTIVLKRGDATERVSIGDDMKTAAPKLKKLDEDFQKALLKLVRSRRTAYLTIGHGELNEPGSTKSREGRTSKLARELLESQNYTIKDLGLGQGLGTDIPEDAGMVLVLGPENAFLPEEVAALSRYADRGGKLLIALDPDSRADHAPLAEMLGLRWTSERLINDKQFLRRRNNDSDKANLLVTGDAQRGGGYSSHASVSTLNKGGSRAGVIFAGASELMKLEGAPGKIDFVIRSSRDEFPDLNGDFAFQSGEEKRGVHNLGAAVSRPAETAAAPAPPKDGEEAKPVPSAEDDETKAFVLADADVLSDAALGASDWNKVLFLDSIRWLGGEESFVGGLASTQDVTIEHSQQEDAVWFYGTIIVAPMAILGLGLWRTQRRRRRSPTKSKRTPTRPNDGPKVSKREK